MTDEGSTPVALPPEPAPPVEASPAPVPESAPTPPIEPAAPIVPTQAITEITEALTDAVTDAMEAAVAPVPAVETPIEPQPASAAPAPTAHVTQTPKSSAGAHMREVEVRHKNENIEKVMQLALEKRNIVNDDVQKLTGCSDATATRYLSSLVKSGRLRRISHDGGTRYEPSDGSTSAS